jgi:DNA polymerase-4
MNSYFASVEQAANPFLKGKPVVVGGGIKKTSVVAAASYEAKARGVKNGMSTWDAKKLCPDLVVIEGDMSKYISTSKAIMKYLTSYTDLVEVFSIDEAWMDVTETKQRLEIGDETRLRQGFGGQGCGEIEIAKRIKKWIRENFRLTCNIGISYNKLMAKFAGELKKPDALIILRPEDIPDKIKDVPVSKLCGVGMKLGEYLAELNVRTFGELNAYPREKLVKRFGTACGEHLWHMGRGIDNSPVMPYWYETDAKSMGHSYHMPRFTKDMDEIKGYLLRLSEQVGRRLRRENYQGNIVHFVIGYACPPKLDLSAEARSAKVEERRRGDHQYWSKQKKLSDYIDDGYDIFKAAESLFDNDFLTLNPRLFSRLNPTPHNGARFVGVSISGLRRNLDQISIFETVENKKKALKAVDEINDRFGEFTVERASIINTVLHKKTGMVASGLYKKF